METVSGQLPSRKIALGLVLSLGLGEIFLGGNCPRTYENYFSRSEPKNFTTKGYKSLRKHWIQSEENFGKK